MHTGMNPTALLQVQIWPLGDGLLTLALGNPLLKRVISRTFPSLKRVISGTCYSFSSWAVGEKPPFVQPKKE